MQIVVVGGTGFIGMHLVRALVARGDEVVVPSRAPDRARRLLPAGATACSLDDGPLLEALTGSDALVNLAGENVMAKRWTPARVQELRSSRIDVTQRLVGLLARLPKESRPTTLVNASAIGWYGDTGEHERAEDAPPADDVLGRMCADWEAAASKAEELGVRVVRVRTGIVLGRGGGALPLMERPFRLFVGGPVGSGDQWMSWIHEDDLTAILLHAMDSDVRGPINAVAPEPVRMKRFAAALGRAMDRPSWAPVPGFALKLVLGERALPILASARVVPRVALESGYRFGHEAVEGALVDLYAR